MEMIGDTPGILGGVLALLCSVDATSGAAPNRRLLQLQAATCMAVCRRWRAELLQQSRSWRAPNAETNTIAAAAAAAAATESRLGGAFGSNEWQHQPPPLEGGRRRSHGASAPATVATTVSQRASLAHRYARNPTAKHALYESCSLENRSVFFAVSCRPITKAAEDDMEMLSDLVTWVSESSSKAYFAFRAFLVVVVSFSFHFWRDNARYTPFFLEKLPRPFLAISFVPCSVH